LVSSLEPLSTLTRLLDLNLHYCTSLPSSALAPLPFCTALRQLDIRWCPTFALAPLASCRDLRRLYTSENPPRLDLSPLQDLEPGLIIQTMYRTEFLDARDL
jgi:hypothetical protein